MAAHLTILLILTGLTGVHSVTTVSEVSVKVRSSITIPCLYDPKYRNNVKYLCKGYYWSTCSYQVKTNGPSSGRISISDDKNQAIFTVTIKDLTNTDTDFWCIVEINHGQDVGKYFHLSVTQGTPGLYVDHQKITGFIGECVSINCTSGNSGMNEMKWCRLGKTCVTGSASVTISERVYNAFTVTMSGLTTESSGWYYCAQGKFQMPVHVTVTERPSTSTLITTFTTTSLPSDDNFANEGNSAFLLKILVIPLSLLIFTVIVTLFTWFMLKKYKQSHTTPSATTRAEKEAADCNVGCTGKTSIQRSHAENDMDVTYSSVVTKKQPARKAHAENDLDVTYSSVVTKKQPVRKAHAENDLGLTYSSVFTKKKAARQVEAQDNDVTYSTLAQTHQNI